MSRTQKFLFFLILVLAIFFRFYLLRQMPGGLFPDEAANGLDINLMQQHQLQPFYERGNGREALFFYMEWASIEVFGKGPWQHHAVSALIGVLATIACFFATRRLFLVGEDPRDPKAFSKASSIALLAMFFMAVSSWHVVLSRTAFRANLIPLFSTLTIYFLIGAYQALTVKTRLWYSLLSGAAFALGFYTYIAFRIMAPILGMMVLWPFLASLLSRTVRANLRKFALPALFSALAFFAVIFPLARYFYTHPGSFIGRSGQVSVFNPELYLVDGNQLHGDQPLGVSLSAIGEVAKVSLLGYFTRGDLNWRHNISGYPFLSPLISPFFAFGLLASLFLGIRYFCNPRKSVLWKFFVLTGWFWGMLLPVVTTAEGIPHGLRSIGTIPPVFIMAAWAAYAASLWVYRQHQKIWERCFCRDDHKSELHENPHSGYFAPLRKSWAEYGIRAAAVCFFAALTLQTYFLYFGVAYNSPENFYSFRSDLTDVSRYLTGRCQGYEAAHNGASSRASTYLVLDKFSVQTPDYMTSDWHGNFSDPCSVPYRQVDPENSWELSGLAAGDQIVFTQSSIFDIAKFKQYHPLARLVLERRNKFGQAVLAVYEMQ